MELVSPGLVNIMVVLAIVTGLAIAVWWIIAVYWSHSREVEAELRHIKLPAELSEVITGFPPAITIFFIFTLVTLVAYVIYIWLSGVSY